MTLRLAVIGLGSMGRHHVRNIRAMDGEELVAIVDPVGDPFGCAGPLPVLSAVSQALDVGIDAAVVAVPTVFHEEVALQLAEAGVHALIEKPLAASVESGQRIAEAFSSRGLVGAVGYVERCNPALMEMRQRIADGQLGRVYQIVTRRQSPFPARISDVGVVKDLATHDVDLTAWVAGSSYSSVFAKVAHQSGREFEDLFVASGELKNGVLVNHLVNWMTPFKERTTIVTGEYGALVADTMMGDLTFYENGSMPLQWDHIAQFRGVSEGQVTRYAVEKREPLAVEHKHFRDAILHGGTDCVSMNEGLETLRVIEALLQSAYEEQVVRL